METPRGARTIRTLWLSLHWGAAGGGHLSAKGPGPFDRERGRPGPSAVLLTPPACTPHGCPHTAPAAPLRRSGSTPRPRAAPPAPRRYRVAQASLLPGAE